MFLLFLVQMIDAQSQGIEHVVAVMFENRAFDHLLGHLTKFNKNINGLTGQESNPIDPSNPSAGSQQVSFDADDMLLLNPGHTVPLTQVEMFGQNSTIIDPAPMNGFITELIKDGNHPAALARRVMACFNQTTIPTLSWLARNYAVFDSWFSSVPGPTMVNRMFAWSGTSAGYAQNSFIGDLFGFNQTSIFGQVRIDLFCFRLVVLRLFPLFSILAFSF